MVWYFTPYVIPLMVFNVVLLSLAVIAWQRRSAPGSLALMGLCLAVIIYASGYILELGSTSVIDVRLWLKVEYIGVSFIPVTLLSMVFSYAGYRWHTTLPGLILLVTLPLATIAMAWTNDSHGMIWQHIMIDTSGTFTRTLFERGAWYWVQASYINAMILASIIALVPMYFRTVGLYRSQIGVLLIGISLPELVFLAYLAGLTPPGLDPNPYASIATGLLAALGLYRYRLFNIIPIAHEAVLTALPVAVVVVDGLGHIININPAARQLIEAGPVIGRPVLEVFATWPDLLEKWSAGSGRFDLVRVIQGEKRYFEVDLSPLHGGRGASIGRLLVMQDVTEENRAADELRRHRDHLEEMVQSRTAELVREKEQTEAILRSAAYPIVFVDADGSILSANAAFEHQTGFRVHDVLGQHATFLTSHLMAAECPMDSVKQQRDNGVWRTEIVMQRKDGSSFEADLSLVMLQGGDGTPSGYVASFRDISSFREVERMKDALLATAAHELRTPLTSIQGFSEILLTRELEIERQKRYLTFINDQARQLAQIISDQLDISRLESGQSMVLNTQPVQVASLAKGVMQPFIEAHPDRHFSFEEAGEPLVVSGDPLRLSQVLTNLLSNAVKYSPECTPVTILCRKQGRFAVISVRDSGIGIPPEYHERIFERFYRVDTSDTSLEGTGLGLAICKLVVEGHGGQITVNSAPGQGSTFSFTIPLQAGG